MATRKIRVQILELPELFPTKDIKSKDIVVQNYENITRKHEAERQALREKLKPFALQKEEEKRRTKEKLEKLAAEGRELKKQEDENLQLRRKYIQFQRDPCVEAFNRTLRTHCLIKENENLAAFKTFREKEKQEYDAKFVEHHLCQSTVDEVEKQREKDKTVSDENLKLCEEKATEAQQERQRALDEQRSQMEEYAEYIKNHNKQMAEKSKKTREFLEQNVLPPKIPKEIQLKLAKQRADEMELCQSLLEAERHRRATSKVSPYKQQEKVREAALEKLAAMRREQDSDLAFLEEKEAKRLKEQFENEGKRMDQEAKDRYAMRKSIVKFNAERAEERNKLKTEEDEKRYKHQQKLVESYKLYEMEMKKAAQLLKDRDLAFYNANVALAEERNAYKKEDKRKDDERTLMMMSTEYSPEGARALRAYIKAELATAAEMGLDVEHVNWNLDSSSQCYMSHLENPLRKYGSDEAQTVKHIQGVRNMVAPLCNKNQHSVPPLQRPIRNSICVQELIAPSRNTTPETQESPKHMFGSKNSLITKEILRTSPPPEQPVKMSPKPKLFKRQNLATDELKKEKALPQFLTPPKQCTISHR